MAMIGEKGRELVKLPNGQSFVSPDSHTMLNLPKGSHVIPNKQTEQLLKSDLPHYAKGTSGWLSAIGDVWDYVKHPSKIVSKIWDNITLQSGMAQIPKKIVSSSVNFLKDKPKEFIKKMFDDADSDGKPNFGWAMTSPFGMRFHPIDKVRKLHGGVDFGAPNGTPIPSMTGGKVTHAGRMGSFGNLVRVSQGIMDYYYAHMSKIMTSVGKSVKKGDILGLVGSTGASTGNHLHYEVRKNGSRIDPMSLKGFKTGGLINNKQLAWLGEDGFSEMVIPLDPKRRPDAMKLLALTAKMIDADGGKRGSKLPYQLPNIRENNNNDNEYLGQMLQATLEQNKQQSQMINLLTQILKKETDIILDTDKLGKSVTGVVSNRIDSNTDKRLKYAGVKG